MYIYAKQRTAGLPLHPLFCCISGGYHNRTSKTDLGFAGRTRLPDIPTDCHSSSHQRQGRTKIRGYCFKKGQGYFLDAGRREKTPVYPEPNARRTTWNGLYMLCRRHFVHLSPNTHIEQQLFSEKLCSSLQKTPHRPARDISKRDSHEVFFIHSFLSFLFFSIRLTVLLTLLRLLSAPHNAFHV